MLLDLKLSLTDNEHELINRYRKLHPEFPHESTTDEFFKKEQFEAYRQLRAHIADGLFSPALLKKGGAPANFTDGFRQLAGDLLVR